MYEQEKLNEAEHFFRRMSASVEDRAVFRFELSAFLSAARSVLQYAYEEVTKQPGGQQWYEAQVAGNAVLQFFKDKRDINIHVEPVKPVRQIFESITDHLHLSDSARLDIRRADGTVEVVESQEEPPNVQQQVTTTQSSVRYAFKDWNGPEDVIDLSAQYLASL